MKSLKLTGIRQLSIDDEPVPQLREGQVLVAIKSVGICGSDVHYYRQGRIGADRCVYPQHLGHECAGQVVKAFSSSPVREGTRVAIEPARPCMHCELCRSGRYNCCPNVKFLGSPGMPGAMQEYVALDVAQVVRIPDRMTYDEAALLEPLGVAYHTIRLASLQPGQSIAIFGAGPIGLSVLAMARACGASETFIFDRLDYRLNFATNTYHADHAVNVTGTDPLEYLRASTGGRGVDIAFEAVGEPQTVNWSFEAARIGGSSMIIGIPEVDTIEINPHPMRRRELLIRNVRRSNMALEPCVDLVARGRVSVAPMATHHSTLEQTPAAFDLVSAYGDGVIKAMVTP